MQRKMRLTSLSNVICRGLGVGCDLERNHSQISDTQICGTINLDEGVSMISKNSILAVRNLQLWVNNTILFPGEHTCTA